MILYIKVGSITNAQRSQKILRAKGYKVQLKKIENPGPNDGCGYALEVISNSNEPVKILEKNGITVLGTESR
ncbi:MAG: putative Se/S carrier-like protein [Eubacterium sp.]